MENAPTEVEIETLALKDELIGVLEAMPGRVEVNEARVQEQINILKRLPKDFAAEIQAHILNSTSKHGIEPGQVDGELFEFLVRADKNICPKPESELAVQLRSVMKDPGRYRGKDFKFFNAFRQPDIAEVDEETGKITGAVEVKLSGVHSGSQLEFGKNFRKALGVLRSAKTEVLKDHGLEKIAQNQDKLWVSSDFKTRLAVTFGIYDGTIDSLTPEDMPDYVKKRINESLEGVTVVQSPFSLNEVIAMSDYLIKKSGIAPLPRPEPKTSGVAVRP